MKRETKETVKKSLLDIEERLEKSVGADKLHEHESMSDEEFKELVQTLTHDVVREFEDAKKRSYEEGFQAGLKAAGESRPLVVTQQPSFEREIANAERNLSQKIEGLFSEHDKIHRQLEEADRSLHSEIRELRGEIEAITKKPAEMEEEREEITEEAAGETPEEEPSEETREEEGEQEGPEEAPEEPRRPARTARRLRRRKRRR